MQQFLQVNEDYYNVNSVTKVIGVTQPNKEKPYFMVRVTSGETITIENESIEVITLLHKNLMEFLTEVNPALYRRYFRLK